MEHLIAYLNQQLPENIMSIVVALHTTPGHLIVAAAMLFLILLFRLVMRYPIRTTVKLALYLRRKNLFYRLLFHRYEKLARPLRFWVYLYLMRQMFELFVATDRIEFFFDLLSIFVVAWWVYEVVKFFLYASLSIRIRRQEKVRKEFFNLFLNVVKIIIAAVVLVIVLSRMGVDLTGLVTSLGIGGVLIGFTAKDTLTNFFDSIRLVSEQAFSLGEWIETEDVEGLVVEIGLAATRIRTFENALVTIPNSRLANSAIRNWSARLVGRRIKFNLRLRYTYDMEEMHRVLTAIRAMLEHHPDIVNDDRLRDLIRAKRTVENGLFNIEDKYGVKRTLLIYFDQIDAYSMNILVYAFSISVNWEEWLRVKQDVLTKIIQIIDDSTLELAVPAEEIHLLSKGEDDG
jgi:MscS family membrane protein